MGEKRVYRELPTHRQHVLYGQRLRRIILDLDGICGALSEHYGDLALAGEASAAVRRLEEHLREEYRTQMEPSGNRPEKTPYDPFYAGPGVDPGQTSEQPAPQGDPTSSTGRIAKALERIGGAPSLN